MTYYSKSNTKSDCAAELFLSNEINLTASVLKQISP